MGARNNLRVQGCMNLLQLHRLEDNCGNKIIETDLRELMHNQIKFIEGETLLQNIGWNVGEHRDHIIVNHTTNYNAITVYNKLKNNTNLRMIQ